MREIHLGFTGDIPHDKKFGGASGLEFPHHDPPMFSEFKGFREAFQPYQFPLLQGILAGISMGMEGLEKKKQHTLAEKRTNI